MKRVIFLVGPTASGKTDVAVSLAKKINAEIISCDSMQVYRGMDILSQKPTKEQLKNINHHLVGVLSPRREYSVAIFKKKCDRLIKEIHRKEKNVLIVGGSGLYVKALTDGLFPSRKKNIKLRRELYLISKKFGNSYLHTRLKEVDPDAAHSIHLNNTRRVVRALEVYQTMGVSFSEMKSKTIGLSGAYEVILFGLNYNRQVLYERINKRVDEMLKEGLVKEVLRLRRRKLSQTAGSILGYKEIVGYLKGDYTLEDAACLLKRNTRRFAKKQLSWFRRDKRILWVDVQETATKSRIVNKILTKLKKAL